MGPLISRGAASAEAAGVRPGAGVRREGKRQPQSWPTGERGCAGTPAGPGGDRDPASLTWLSRWAVVRLHWTFRFCFLTRTLGKGGHTFPGL